MRAVGVVLFGLGFFCCSFILFLHWFVPTLEPRSNGKLGLRLPQSQEKQRPGDLSGKNLDGGRSVSPLFKKNPHARNSGWQKSSQPDRLKISQQSCPALCPAGKMTRTRTVSEQDGRGMQAGVTKELKENALPSVSWRFGHRSWLPYKQASFL